MADTEETPENTEDIALSTGELDNVLADTEETPENTEDFFDGDDDTPITLSDDEMDVILAEAHVEDELDNISVTAETEETSAPENSDLSNEIDDKLSEDTELNVDSEALQLDEDQAEQEFHASDSSMYEPNQAELTALTEDLDKNPLTTEEDRHEDIIAEDRELESTSAPIEPETSQIVSDQEGVVEFDSKLPEAVQDPETEDLKSVMGYLDQLLGELPDDTIKKFANSEYFNLYQKVLDQLGL